MDFADLKNKSAKELKELLAATRENWRELRFKAGNRELKQSHSVRLARQLCARISFLLGNTDKKAGADKSK